MIGCNPTKVYKPPQELPSVAPGSYPAEISPSRVTVRLPPESWAGRSPRSPGVFVPRSRTLHAGSWLADGTVLDRLGLTGRVPPLDGGGFGRLSLGRLVQRHDPILPFRERGCRMVSRGSHEVPGPSHPFRWFPEFLELSHRRLRPQARLLGLSLVVGVISGIGAIVFFAACQLVFHFALMI